MVGDRVLVKNVREKGGPGKIRSYWEQKVYVVNEKKGEVVYSVIEEGEKDETKKRVLHRNMLLPVSQWFLLERPKKSMKTPKRNTNKKNRSVSKAHTEVENPSESEDDQDGEWFAIQDMQDITQHNGVVGDRRDAVEDQENDLEPDPEVVASEESDGEVTVEYDEEEGRQLLDELTGVGVESEGEEIVHKDPEEHIEDMRVEREENEGEPDGREIRDEVVEENREIQNGPGNGNVEYGNSGRQSRLRAPPKVFTYSELGVPSLVDPGVDNLIGQVKTYESHLPYPRRTVGPVVDAQSQIFPHDPAVNPVVSNVYCYFPNPSQFSVGLTNDAVTPQTAYSDTDMTGPHVTQQTYYSVPGSAELSNMALSPQFVPVEPMYLVDYAGNQFVAPVQNLAPIQNLAPVQNQSGFGDQTRQFTDLTNRATAYTNFHPLPPSVNTNRYGHSNQYFY